MLLSFQIFVKTLFEKAMFVITLKYLQQKKTAWTVFLHLFLLSDR